MAARRKSRRGGAIEIALSVLGVLCFTASAWHERVHSPSYAPAARSQGLVRIVTWNVGAGIDRGGDGLRDSNLSHVVRVIAQIDPDLVLLQEVSSAAQLARLRASLGPAWFSAISQRAGGRRVAALARGPIEAFHDGAGGRTLGVRARLSAGIVDALAVHADAFSASERNDVIGRATQALLARSDDEASIRVLAGDLNLDLDLDKRRDLFTDDEYLDIETYNFATAHLVDAAAGTGPTAEPDRRLDYVLFATRSHRLGDAGPWRNQRGEGMDHDPVVLDLLER